MATLEWATATDWNNASKSGVINTNWPDQPGDDVLTLGLIEYQNADIAYDFDTAAATDRSGNNRDGTLNSAASDLTSETPGLFGTSGLQFEDGADEWVDTGHATDYQNAVALVAYIRPQSPIANNDFGVIWSKNSYFAFDEQDFPIALRVVDKGSGNFALALALSSGNDFSTDDSIETATTWSYGTPLLVGAWYDGSTDAGVVVDGVTEASATIGYNISNSDRNWGIGRAPVERDGGGGGTHYDGIIDFPMLFGDFAAIGEGGLQTVTDPSGSVTTATKTFSESVSAVDYQYTASMPAAGSVDVDIVASPGSGSEERQTVSLADGTNSGSVSFTNTHTDFRLEQTWDTTDITVTPTLDSVSLSFELPSNLTTGTVTGTSIDLSWNSGTFDQFDVLRAEATGSVYGDYSVIDTTTGSSYTDDDTGSGLENGERYFYRVIPTSVSDDLANATNEVDAVTDLSGPTTFSASNT